MRVSASACTSTSESTNTSTSPDARCAPVLRAAQTPRPRGPVTTTTSTGSAAAARCSADVQRGSVAGRSVAGTTTEIVVIAGYFSLPLPRREVGRAVLGVGDPVAAALQRPSDVGGTHREGVVEQRSRAHDRDARPVVEAIADAGHRQTQHPGQARPDLPGRPGRVDGQRAAGEQARAATDRSDEGDEDGADGRDRCRGSSGCRYAERTPRSLTCTERTPRSLT